jgi:GNAT superfamily N-acetyltransferase
MKIDYRFATVDDAPLLAAMNARLIRDEGHRCRLSLVELQERHAGWLSGEYLAVMFGAVDRIAGYALYKHEPEWIYLRQFFVEPEYRRQGIGRRAIAWLMENAWSSAPRIRLDVLVGNHDARAFWQSLGFRQYCVTMELERPST